MIEQYYAHLPFPVVADTSAGYYIPVTEEEVDHYRRSLLSRAECILLRARSYEAQLALRADSSAPARLNAFDRLLAHFRALSL